MSSKSELEEPTLMLTLDWICVDVGSTLCLVDEHGELVAETAVPADAGGCAGWASDRLVAG